MKNCDQGPENTARGHRPKKGLDTVGLGLGTEGGRGGVHLILFKNPLPEKLKIKLV